MRSISTVQMRANIEVHSRTCKGRHIAQLNSPLSPQARHTTSPQLCNLGHGDQERGSSLPSQPCSCRVTLCFTLRNTCLFLEQLLFWWHYMMFGGGFCRWIHKGFRILLNPVRRLVSLCRYLSVDSSYRKGVYSSSSSSVSSFTSWSSVSSSFGSSC